MPAISAFERCMKENLESEDSLVSIAFVSQRKQITLIINLTPHSRNVLGYLISKGFICQSPNLGDISHNIILFVIPIQLNNRR
jgi:hypothetical protein